MRLLFILLLIAVGHAAVADDARPPAGLLWKRSDLPATLPLQLKTPAGQDYVVFLTRPEVTEPEMAAYVRGGSFFRLLVPPGDWRISIASGQQWQGEERLFGPETNWTELSDPLNFMAGNATMNGHVLSIDDAKPEATITVAPRVVCRVPSYQSVKPERRDAPPSPVIRQDRATPYRLDPRDPLAHDRLSDGRLDPRDPLAHDRLSGRLDPRDPLAHDRLARTQRQPRDIVPPQDLSPSALRRGQIRLRSVTCD
ncbi:hypothetical protein FQV27_00590 [Paracoccus aurantiacus]|uniref:DUF2846 domain-containing protein n=1 Tax=Paracoccus aurantiacus TaxID=2599412 RepID=A0A5C6S7P6_9RHOB|nr:hypothetical protein [Paracoccus aurantiacus]TXB70410.1 hypothetical protein FQV27_00590 [Paracoccus aurantiacus]